MTVRRATVSPENFLVGLSAGPGPGPAAGTVVGRDGPMTNPTADRPVSPLDLLDRHLARRSVGRRGTDALHRLADAGVPTAGSPDLHHLARSCRAGGDPARSEVVTAALLTLASHDETAGLCLLVIFGPVLRRFAGRLVRVGVDRDEAEQRVVAACWAAVADGAGVGAGAGAGAGTVDGVLGRTWSTLRTDVRRELRRRAIEPPAAHSRREPVAPGLDPAEQASTVLDDAWRAGALTRRQVLLLHQTRVLDRPVDEVAGASGQSRGAVWKEGQRAMRDLRRFLADDPSVRSLRAGVR